MSNDFTIGRHGSFQLRYWLKATQVINHSDKKELGIEGYPAEKSMYKAIFESNKVHRKIGNLWQITPPENKIYAKVWK